MTVEHEPAAAGNTSGITAARSDPAPGVSAVPAWLGTLAGLSWRLVVVVVLVVVVLAIGVRLMTVTAAVLVALLVAAFFAPLDARLRARGWAPTKAASATSVVALVTALAAALLVVVGFAPAVAELIRYGKEGTDLLANQLRDLGFSETAVTFVTGVLVAFEEWITDAVGSAVTRIADVGTVLILGGFLTFYVLQSGDRAWGGVARELAGPNKACT